MKNSTDGFVRVALVDAEDEGFITLKDAAEAAQITPLTANKRLSLANVTHTAFGTRESAGRPARLFPRVPALEAVMNSIGERRASAETLV